MGGGFGAPLLPRHPPARARVPVARDACNLTHPKPFPQTTPFPIPLNTPRGVYIFDPVSRSGCQVLPKTCLTPRYPWDRAALSVFEAKVYEFAKESYSQTGTVPGKRAIMKKFGCTELAALTTLKRLVYKGWLGEAGERFAQLYLNDKPKDLED